MVKYANLNDAQREVINWGGDPYSVQHIGDRGNSIFSFKNTQNQLQILRFTDPMFRSFDEVCGELNFVNYLFNDKVCVAPFLNTLDGKQVYHATTSSGQLICSSVAFAEGLEINQESEYWNKTFFNEWGRNLGLIHKSSHRYTANLSTNQRWVWQDEIFIAQAKKLIPAEDKASLEEFAEVTSLCLELPQVASEFGLIHADHAPQNFKYNPAITKITVFDFGNCCYHWFVADLAITLSTIRRKLNREEVRDGILQGYTKIRALPKNHDQLIDLFIRLRVIYVYLSRLYFWSQKRTIEQNKELIYLQNLVHQKTGWPK